MQGTGTGGPNDAGRRRGWLRSVPASPGAEATADRRQGLESLRQQGLESLLEAAGRGDHDAFAALYDELSAGVYGLVRRVLRDPAQSEEVTQEVFLEVWRTAPRFDAGRGTARTWVLTMAHRRAVDRVRSEQASRAREDRVGARERVPAVDVVAEAVESGVERQAVRDALARLTDLQRQALELAYFGGLTYREVAERLGAPLPTVKTRMRDGLLRLRQALESPGLAPEGTPDA
jgi:RNA polymerase sigma-70 factor (ECF subfamily)